MKAATFNNYKRRFSVLKPVRRYQKPIAWFFIGVIAFPYFTSTEAKALTAGPAAPEFSSFSQAGTSDMVDLYSGDFKYNVPLMTIPGPNGGYPISLNYNSGIGMEDEATWVGLGWNLNVGSIQRTVRGVPDDFKGDEIRNEFHTMEDFTISVDIDPNTEVAESYGIDYASAPFSSFKSGIKLNHEIYYNSFKGLGYCMSTNFTDRTPLDNIHPSLGVRFDSNNGLELTPALGISGNYEQLRGNLRVGTSISNRNGVQALNFSSSGRIGSYGERSGALFSHNFSFFQGLPKVKIPRHTTSVPLSLALGVPAAAWLATPLQFGEFSAEFPAIWRGSYQKNAVADGGIVVTPSYGYINTHNAGPDDMMDVNVKDIEYSKKISNISPAVYTYDTYVINGQGTGGMFRPHRSDVRILHDAASSSTSSTTEVPVEFGLAGQDNPAAPPAAIPPYNYHVGVDLNLQSTVSTTGDWSDGTTDMDGLQNTPTDKSYENVYFKFSGEPTSEYVTEQNYSDWMSDDALRASLDLDGNAWFDHNYVLNGNFQRDALDAPFAYTSNMKNKSIRQRRARHVRQLTNEQVDDYPAQFNVKYYNGSSNIGRSSWQIYNHTNTGSPYDKDDFPSHTAQFEVTETSGTRYIYGLPAYNVYQEEINTSLNEPDFETGSQQVNRHDVASNSYTQTLGGGIRTNEYLSKTVTPAYVYSWMLTSVVSSDYIDRTKNGPTNDDLGYWTKFHYKRVYNAYKWRAPYTKGNFNNACETDPKDNTAFFTYGEKEVFYIDTIETKSHYAVFYTSERHDAMEAPGEYGNSGTGSNGLHKLDSLKLFAKNNCGGDHFLAQTVFFEYDYSLCPLVENNDGVAETVGGIDINRLKGKLTLKKVWFKFEQSARGQKSPYTFSYGPTYSADPGGDIYTMGYREGDVEYEYNPAYNHMNLDRWGTFYDHSRNYAAGIYPYFKFPYTPQDDALTNDKLGHNYVAGQWSLHRIDLPTGGDINIEYESDDYAYVENKHAMQMFDIYCIGGIPGATHSVRDAHGPPNTTETDIHIAGDDGNYRVYFKLDRALPTGDFANATAEQNYVLRHFIRDQTKLYFKENVNLKGPAQDNWDYVSGYVNIMIAGHDGSSKNFYGLAKSDAGLSEYDLGYITVEKEELTSVYGYTNPMRKAAFQFLKLNRQELLSNPIAAGTSTTDAIANVLNVLTAPGDVAAIIFGFYGFCKLKKYAQDIQVDGKSIIRLCEPDGKKYGGGSRVKKLYLHETWYNNDQFCHEPDDAYESNYGQEYFYDENGDGTGESSGVAYEPQTGNEESALKQPLEYEQSTFMSTHYNLFLEAPLLEEFYPGAGVGYGKVTVKSIAPGEAENSDGNSSNGTPDMELSAAPYTVTEYYTAKDFPVITDETDLSNEHKILRPVVIPGLYNGTAVRLARSQGYCVVTNDMPGKEKKVSTYRRFPSTAVNNLISQVEYIYKTTQPYSPNKVNQLENRVQTMYYDNISNKYKYLTAYIGQTQDVYMHRNENKTRTSSKNVDLNADWMTTPTPLLSIVPIPNIRESTTSFRTVVTMKAIHKMGVLEKVITHHDNASIASENLAYDVYTGQPLLTKTYNEFNDPVYNLNFPAYWYYKGLESKSRNNDITFTALDISGYDNTDGKVTLASTPYPKITEGDELCCNNGAFYAHAVNASSIGSGYFYLVKSDGTIPSALSEFTIVRSGKRNNIAANAGALAFKTLNGYSTAVTSTALDLTFDDVIDASAIEFDDDWQTVCSNCEEIGVDEESDVDPYEKGIWGNYIPKATYHYFTDRSFDFNAQTDGVFKDFTLFQWANPGGSGSSWVHDGALLKHSPYGFELESRDALGNYSANIYGYNNQLIKATGKNTRSYEFLFDGFEDYCTNQCSDPEATDYDYKLFNHMTSESAPAPALSESEAHTGYFSMSLGNSTTKTFTILRDDDLLDCPDKLAPASLRGEGSIMNACRCLNRFTLQASDPAKRYVFSCWVKQVKKVPYAGGLPASTYTAPELDITVNAASLSGGSDTYAVTAGGKIIEGWQRMYYVVEIPDDYSSVEIEFKNVNSTNFLVYYDDARLFPFNAMMNSYVYNQTNFKLEAQLDENNYATFYIYDEAGNLNKIKKETVEGIKTLKEGRISTRKVQ